MNSQTRLSQQQILVALAQLAESGNGAVSSTQLAEATRASWSAVKRSLTGLVAEGRVVVEGKARATRYRLPSPAQPMVMEPAPVMSPTSVASALPAQQGPLWSARSLELRRALSTAPTARPPVTYRRHFVDGYKPNESFLLPQSLSEELMNIGRLPEQLPAGTYARKVLEQLLIDLSWSSSRLEGNRYTLLDTEQLFKSGQQATDQDGVMLLNHKVAIEFLVDAVPTLGLTPGLLQNLHSILMRDLLSDPHSLGAIRAKLVNISGTAYVPAQVPHLLREMFERVVSTAQHIKNPVEAAFFLWVNLAYLQPFEDGNKRVSRLAANVPLMLYNQAPLSFLDVDRHDYALAMMGVYEFCDVSMAVDLFAWTYRRSQAKYKVVLEAMSAPDPFRVSHRETLNDAIVLVVRDRQRAAQAAGAVGLSAADTDKFKKMLDGELDALQDYNCARYRLRPRETCDWIQDGRPR
ncbi:MAG TPA: Fic family protein [Ramlibacter sp.]|nr:Fic family protein [Ramlibacter sp.]